MKVGDVVILKSGGPLMTISFVNQHPDGQSIVTIQTRWFDHIGVLHHAEFDEAMLEPRHEEA
jgi:uncharacterized protein YodC (DUF2158 family)